MDPGAPVLGVPVAPFPRWMRCSLCDTLATVDSGVFRLKQDPWRPDKTEYQHEGCARAASGRNPSALSVRFLLACREGHLTDFPWLEFVHKGKVPCKPAQLTLREFGISGDASDIIVKCLECNDERRMADAFDRDVAFTCPAHHPHLRLIESKGCKEQAKTILLGASNSWFAVALSALSIPQASDRLGKLIEEKWVELKGIESAEEVLFYRKNIQKFPTIITLFSEFSNSEIWDAIQAKRAASGKRSGPVEDLKLPEWQVFSNPETAEGEQGFQIAEDGSAKWF